MRVTTRAQVPNVAGKKIESEKDIHDNWLLSPYMNNINFISVSFRMILFAILYYVPTSIDVNANP